VLVAGFVGLAGAAPLLSALTGVTELPRALVAGIPAAMVVAGALMLERANAVPRLPGLRWMGDTSYSLYLSLPIVLSAFAQLWRKAGLHLLPGGVWCFGVVAVLVCIAAGGAVYRWIEQPLNRRFGATTGARTGR